MERQMCFISTFGSYLWGACFIVYDFDFCSWHCVCDSALYKHL